MNCPRCEQYTAGDLEYYDMQGRRICLPCWAKMMEDIDSRVALTAIGEGDLRVEVSTVLIGLNMNFSTEVPLIFETMIFDEIGGRGCDVYCERYPTREAALAGHDRAVKWAEQQMFLVWTDEAEQDPNR